MDNTNFETLWLLNSENFLSKNGNIYVNYTIVKTLQNNNENNPAKYWVVAGLG